MLLGFTNMPTVVDSKKLVMRNEDTISQRSHGPSAVASNITDPHESSEWYCSECGFGPLNAQLDIACHMCGTMRKT